ncbi:MAG: hypothetical protein P8100_03870 [bacterium]|jgi:hypothetical protein
MWNKLLNQDNYLLGIAIGLALPVIFYALLYLLDMGVVAAFGQHMLRKQEYLLLLSIAINLFPIKYYFVNLQFDKTGRGVLVITFVKTLLYFVLS